MAGPRRFSSILVRQEPAVPTYAIPAYVAASRVHDNRHYASDVVAGATLGIIIGRSVTWHGRSTWGCWRHRRRSRWHFLTAQVSEATAPLCLSGHNRSPARSHPGTLTRNSRDFRLKAGSYGHPGRTDTGAFGYFAHWQFDLRSSPPLRVILVRTADRLPCCLGYVSSPGRLQLSPLVERHVPSTSVHLPQCGIRGTSIAARTPREQEVSAPEPREWRAGEQSVCRWT